MWINARAEVGTQQESRTGTTGLHVIVLSGYLLE